MHVTIPCRMSAYQGPWEGRGSVYSDILVVIATSSCSMGGMTAWVMENAPFNSIALPGDRT